MKGPSPRIAVFPGSFDPFTLGHEHIARQALPLFDHLIIAIGVNTTKSRFLFTPQQRKEMIAEVFTDTPQVSVKTFQGLTVEFCRQHHARFIIRGVRNALDWDYEQEIALANRQLAPDIRTIFLAPDAEVGHIRSTIVREIAAAGGNITPFVPHPVALQLKNMTKKTKNTGK